MVYANPRLSQKQDEFNLFYGNFSPGTATAFHDAVQYRNRLISVCIVVPTYNELNNILKLFKGLFSEKQEQMYSKENILMNVLVVDDNSPDGTADIVRSYQKGNPNIFLLWRNEKNGLGAAYIAGMQHAMKLLDPDIIFEMDGDLSHGPEYIMPMIRKIKKGADVVIGSRYVKGGSIPKNWGWRRKLISKAANTYAKTFLGIREVNDLTGGFRAIRTTALREVDFSGLKTKGYAFQISLLVELRRLGAVLEEVPIAFKDRTDGLSKMRMADILEEGFFVLKKSAQNVFTPGKTAIISKEFKHRPIVDRNTYQMQISRWYGQEEEPVDIVAEARL